MPGTVASANDNCENCPCGFFHVISSYWIRAIKPLQNALNI